MLVGRGSLGTALPGFHIETRAGVFYQINFSAS
jgi:hypothetical protein